MVATCSSSIEIVQLLLENGAKVGVTQLDG
ncbi:ankyrin repeat domain-containing protein [Zarconia navalis]|nr:ankyrin repeat domain-containing protein [Zarconia navalis]